MPKSKSPPPWRKEFLRLLSLSGNAADCCRAVGTSKENAYRTRKRNPVFDEAWKRALARAEERLAKGGELPASHASDRRPRLLNRMGRGGGLKLVRAGDGWWSEKKEKRFIETLMKTNNIRAACDEVHASPSTIYRRQHAFPAFDAVVSETRILSAQDLNLKLIAAGSNTLTPPALPEKIDTPLVSIPDAIRIVQMNLPEMRDRPGRAGRPSHAPVRPQLSVDEVCARIEETLARLPDDGVCDDASA